MVDRIKAAVDARIDADFFIMARTDAFAQEGLEAALERAKAYVAAGADGIFAEAVHTLEDYKAFADGIGGAHLLANITEFGATPLFNREELAANGATMVLCVFFPMSAATAPCPSQKDQELPSGLSVVIMRGVTGVMARSPPPPVCPKSA